MIRRVALVVALVGLFVAGSLAPVRVHAQSDALVSVLTEMQQLSQSDFNTLVSWAKNGTPAPFSNFFQPDKTMSDILALGDKDRQAVLWWLQGNGRSALYARGASDYQIGPRRAPVDQPAATPTPAAWREIPLASATLEGGVQGQIQILGGFAAVKRDGTAAIACVSFKNLAPLTARRVIVEFPLLDAQGNSLGSLTLDRNGEFSSNVSISTYMNFATWQQGGIGPRGYADNCIQKTLPTPAVPLLQARTASYRVMRVEYDNGTVWPPASPTP
ncbi:MAG TPA: hypothetical protein VMV65_06805 [Alphaproteobacteria bacterium]|nr:hypothetical protein [Alphaproteobacteria bacterium]